MSSRFNYWDIVHFVFAERMAAKDGYGIVFDNSEEGKPYCAWKLPPIFGYVNWKDGGQEFATAYSEEDLSNDFIVKMHKVSPVTNEIIEGIKHSVYLMNKIKLIDNLSLIEILDKLNEHDRRMI
jgi:hypothetical protein